MSGEVKEVNSLLDLYSFSINLAALSSLSSSVSSKVFIATLIIFNLSR